LRSCGRVRPPRIRSGSRAAPRFTGIAEIPASETTHELGAIANGKPIVLVNAELDSLLGPLLKAKADAADVVITHTDGDEPGVAMTLFRC
jgi:predicted homoserine dehydrogenase-like protein